MGSSSSRESRITREMLEEYAQLTYLNKAEILHVAKLFKSLLPRGTEELQHQRIPVEEILKVVPQLRYNPFRDSILCVFSTDNNGTMSFDDLIDLFSVMSENCPGDVKAAWAFKIFDFDEDNQLSLNDLIKVVEKLTGLKNNEPRIDRKSSKFIAQVIIQELDLVMNGSVGVQEFVHTVSRMPEFAHTFRIKI
ncbi:calcium and integrin-binding protein 1 [Cotesia typhae]|uniref:calcium and integrin-binding protein 1 n=1 Tax=Cotesia typhae TaxID=2053667 RepID=UPI003D68268B